MSNHRRIDLTLGTGAGAVGVNAGGSYAGDAPDIQAVQAATSGAGAGASFTVAISGGAVVSVNRVLTRGAGYAPGDTITIAVPGEIVAAVLDVNTIGGLVDDPDWARMHTLPAFYPDTALHDGGVREETAIRGVISVTLELRDGMDDAAVAVAPEIGATVRMKTVTYLGRDGGVYRQTPEQVAEIQNTYIDDELPRNMTSWVRIHSALLLPAAGALWVDVHTDVGT